MPTVPRSLRAAHRAGIVCLLALALFVMGQGHCRAQDAPPAEAAEPGLEDGYGAEVLGDYSSAAEIYGELAAQGSADAQYALGRLHMDGLLEGASDLEALKWFRQAGEQGHAGAMNAYGYMRDIGRGGPRDVAAAEEWYGRAVARDFTTSMNNLAYLWSQEQRNLNEALALAEQAVARAPDSPHYQDTLGWVLFMQGRYEESLVPLCEAVRLDPREPILREHYGDALWMADRRIDARGEWGEALRLLRNPLELSGNGFESLQNFGPSLLRSVTERLDWGLREETLPAPVAPLPDSRYVYEAGCAQLIG